MKTKEELMDIAERNLADIASSALHEYGYWDGLIEDEELSEEDYQFITDNFIVRVTVEETQ
tara:strand:- start:461 stop:643 length:183 start_codon:yes stop_codon:yes gene_type:complete